MERRRPNMPLRIAWGVGIFSCFLLLINGQGENTGSSFIDTQVTPVTAPAKEITPTPVVIFKR